MSLEMLTKQSIGRTEKVQQLSNIEGEVSCKGVVKVVTHWVYRRLTWCRHHGSIRGLESSDRNCCVRIIGGSLPGCFASIE